MFIVLMLGWPSEPSRAAHISSSTIGYEWAARCTVTAEISHFGQLQRILFPILVHAQARWMPRDGAKAPCSIGEGSRERWALAFKCVREWLKPKLGAYITYDTSYTRSWHYEKVCRAMRVLQHCL
jgi:hypothetical protein